MDKFHLFPPQASTSAHNVDALYFALILISLFFVAVVFLPILFFCIKYRQGSPADRSNPSSGSNLIEFGWTIVPTFMGVALFTWGALDYFQIERKPANAIDMQVVGKQWMWQLQQAERKCEINELHIPVDQTVALTLISQAVVRSFFMPAFRVKQDVVPGKYASEWFKATRVGQYHISWAQYCATQHAQRIGRGEVMQPQAYERWLKSGEQTESIV